MTKAMAVVALLLAGCAHQYKDGYRVGLAMTLEEFQRDAAECRNKVRDLVAQGAKADPEFMYADCMIAAGHFPEPGAKDGWHR